jgi:hypothetical protein
MCRASRAVTCTAFLVLGSVASLCGCASDPGDESTQALADPGGGTGGAKSCKDSYSECHRSCDMAHPWSKDSARKLNSEHRAACESSCQVEYQLCKEPAARQAPGGRIPPTGPSH